MVRGEINEETAYIQARSSMARTLDEIGKKCPAEAEAKVVNKKKPKLDNARKLRGIYFIDPEDKEFKETIKNARKKLEMPMAPAVPCKTSNNSQHWATRGKSNEIKSKLACLLEASESTRLRMGESLPNHHEDHIAGKGANLLQHYKFGTQIYSYASSHENSRSIAAADKEWEN